MTRFMLFAVALVVVLSHAALATPITDVVNPGFETPALPYVVDPGPPVVSVDYVHIANGLPVTGWSANTGDIYILKGADFGLGATASNVGFTEPGSGSGNQIIYQTLADTLQVGTYTLTVAAGHSSTYGEGTPDAKIGFNSYDPNTTLFSELKVDTVAGSSIPTGSLSDLNVVMNVLPGAAHLGEKVVIILSAPAVAYTSNVSFDNVRLDYVPEPSTLVIMATGLISLLAYAWRKRM